MKASELKKLIARQKALVKSIQKNTPKVIWDMVAELIEIEISLEGKSNK